MLSAVVELSGCPSQVAWSVIAWIAVNVVNLHLLVVFARMSRQAHKS